MHQQPPNLRPGEQKPTSTNWLPIILGGAVGVSFLCALGFVIFVLFFFTPQIRTPPTAPTATLNVVSFATLEPGAAAPTQANPDEIPVTPASEGGSSQSQSPPLDTNTGSVGTDTSILTGGAGNVPMTSPDYGIQAFLFWRAEVADRDLGLINDAGFRWVKQEFAWREIEGAGKGIFNWENSDRLMDQIDAHNLNIIARVGVQPEWAGGGFPEIGPPTDYQDFGDFVFELATRYKGRIAAYQIWNEPNLSREWGEQPPNPAEYTELLKIAYESIKRADPDAIVVTAGLAPTTRNDHVAIPDTHFVQGIYDAGAKPYFDMLGVHGAGYRAPPEADPGEVARDPNLSNPGDHEAGVPEELRRIYCFRHVEDVRAIMVQNDDADKRVFVLEFGWTTDGRANSPYRWHHVSEQQQGAYIVGAYKYAKENWQPWIGVMSVIYMPDVEWTQDDEQYYWSIVVPRWPDAWPKPAYHMIKDLPKD